MTATSRSAAPARRLSLHRRVALIGRDVIQVRPARAALLKPLAWLLIGAGCFAAIVAGLAGVYALPVPLMALLLLVAVITIPSAGLGVVYGLVGADVVIDRAKQSATWQQGIMGLGIGTQELVPFWKIAAICVEEAGAAPAGEGSPTEEFAQWQIVLEKTSGRRLVIGGATAPRATSATALAPVTEVASAIAALTGAPLKLPETEAEPEIPPVGSRRRRRARRRARSR